MFLIAMLLLAGEVLSTSPMTLSLEKVRRIDDSRPLEVRDPFKGDRGVPTSCSLSDGTVVTLVRDGDATLEVVRAGSKKTIVVSNVRGQSRPTLTCGSADRFYYLNPRLGRVYGYSAERLFRGEEPVLWSQAVAPFTNADEAGDVMTETSVATVAQARQNLLLVEWFYRKNGETGFFHAVFDGVTGAELGKLGPSDLLVKTNENDPWWVLYQGGGNEVVNYVPRGIYRLTYGPLAPGANTAIETMRGFPKGESTRLKAVAKLSPNPVINHMIALLTPTRTTANSTIEFCPQVPAQRARYWLGTEYHAELGEVARNILLAFWAERQDANIPASPLNAWFQSEIAPKEPMKSLVARFNPQDDRWIAEYQQALLALGGPTFERLFEEYGTATGAVVRIPDGGTAP